MTSNEITFDKIKGLIIGSSVGDALGLPFKFNKDILLYTGNVTDNNYDNGRISSSTEMLLIVINEIKNGYTTSQIYKKYKFYVNKKGKIGNSMKIIFDDKNTSNKDHIESVKIKNESNGALMRCGLLFILNIDLWKNDCMITHNNNISISINIFFLYLLKNIMDNDKNDSFIVKKELIEYALNKINNTQVSDIINSAINKEFIDITVNKGWVLYTLYISVYSLLHFNNYTDAITFVIKSKGDTSTNGAVSGILNGLYYGYELIEIGQKNNIDIIKNNTENNNICDINTINKLKDIDTSINDIICKYYYLI
jgi:ADP-ribosylglycohydrolase